MTDEAPPLDDERQWWSLSAPDVLGSVIALATLAIAQPLLDLIGRNATFLVAHNTRGMDVVALAVALPILLPLLIGAVVLLVRPLNHSAAAVVHAFVLTVFGAALVFLVLRLTGAVAALHWTVAIGVSVLLGAGVPALYHLSATFRRVLLLAAFAAPAVTVLFLFASPARALAFPEPPEPSDAIAADADVPPIVFIIFDELPVASLLGEDRLVDADAFPSFARLAQHSTFFRNASTVHGQTSDAVPAALDGSYPRVDALPVAADHPDNLIALLSGRYRMHVSEALTELCPVGQCAKPSLDEPSERYLRLAKDLAVVGSHLVLPPALTEGLPAIDQGWRDFGGLAEDTGGKERAMHERFHAAREAHPATGFDEFVDGIRPSDEPTLHFVHTLLPHSPWQFLPDGREYAKEWDWPALERGVWVNDEWRVAQTQQRHLLQAQLVDRLLGRLLDKLDETGIYDDAVLVLMADHGASFQPGTSLRVISEQTFGEIADVPLFIKEPNQQRGAVSDLPVELVDLMPSVLDLIGAEPPDDIVGRSVFDESVPPRTSKTFYGPTGPLEFPADGEEKWAAVERKNGWFRRSDAFGFPHGLAPIGQEHLLNTPVPESSPAELPQLSVELDDPAAYADVDLDAPLIPAYLQATVRGPLISDRPAIAIGVNGTIAAVTLLEGGDAEHPLRAMIPVNLLRDGANDLSFWLVQSYGLVELHVTNAGG